MLIPNQIRSNGIFVDDVPKHLANGNSTHWIVLPDEELQLPLKGCGCISYLPVCKPTLTEIYNCSNYKLTSPHPWDPYSNDFQEQQRIFQNIQDFVHQADCYIASFHVTYCEVCDFIYHNIFEATTSRRKLQCSPPELAKHLAVGDTIAEQTIKNTTHFFFAALSILLRAVSKLKLQCSDTIALKPHPT